MTADRVRTFDVDTTPGQRRLTVAVASAGGVTPADLEWAKALAEKLLPVLEDTPQREPP